MSGKPTLRTLWPNLIWQPLMAMLFSGSVLYFLSLFKTAALTWAVGGGAMASSSYIVFGTPSAVTARARNIIGGFLIAIVCGLLVQYMIESLGGGCEQLLHCHAIHYPVFFSAIVVGVVLVLMSVLNCQHPPAAGLSLILVIDLKDTLVLYVIVIGALLLAALSSILKPYLKDLLL